MPLFESFFGISKRKLQSGFLDEVCFDSKNIKGRFVGFPYYYDPLNPSKKLQDADYALDLAVAVTNFEPAGEERLFESLQPFRDYVIDLPLEGEKPLRVEFRVDQEESPSTLLMRLLGVIDEALQSAHLSFHRLRK